MFFNVPLRHSAAVRLSSLSVEFLTIQLRTTVGLEGLTWPLALDTTIRTENWKTFHCITTDLNDEMNGYMCIVHFGGSS